jgi:hypothetical protein
MSTRSTRLRQGQLILALATTAAIVAAIWIGGSIEWAIPSAIVMLGFIAAMVLRDRSQTAEVVYGVGDERTRSLYLKSTSAAGTAMLAVIVVWYLVTVAAGDPDETLGALAVLFNGTLIASAAAVARRG